MLENLHKAIDDFLIVKIIIMVIALCALTYAGQLDNCYGNEYDIRGTVAGIGYTVIAAVSILAFIGYSIKKKREDSGMGVKFNMGASVVAFGIIWIFLFPAPIRYLLGDLDWLTSSPVSKALTIISATLLLGTATRELIVDLPMLLGALKMPECN